MKKDGTVICSHCGRTITIEYRYCPYCGYEIIGDYTESENHSPQTLMEEYVRAQLKVLETQLLSYKENLMGKWLPAWNGLMCSECGEIIDIQTVTPSRCPRCGKEMELY